MVSSLNEDTPSVSKTHSGVCVGARGGVALWSASVLGHLLSLALLPCSQELSSPATLLQVIPALQPADHRLNSLSQVKPAFRLWCQYCVSMIKSSQMQMLCMTKPTSENRFYFANR